jgi:transcription-repair coupling factor (superfamily II helicase)
VEEVVDPSLDLKVSAYLPDSFIPETSDRLGIYKRLSGAATEEAVRELCDEVSDRYGPMPPEAVRLAQVMEIKSLARALKVSGIMLMQSEVKITFSEKVDISPDRLLGFLRKSRGMARYVPQYSLFLKKPSDGWEGLYSLLKNSLKELV